VHTPTVDSITLDATSPTRLQTANCNKTCPRTDPSDGHLVLEDMINQSSLNNRGENNRINKKENRHCHHSNFRP